MGFARRTGDWIENRPVFGMCLLVALVSTIVFLNALGNEFVFDDKVLVVENEAIRSFRNIPEVFGDNLWGFLGRASNYYRPLPPLLYMLTYQFAGLTPWVFHAVNILLHAGTSVLAFLIVLNLLGRHHPVEAATNRWAALAGALVFATHPIHTEAVTWVAGIMDLGCTFFALLSFYCYLRSDRTRLITKYYVVSLVSFFLATLTKEPALILPVLLFAAEHVLADPGGRSIVASARRISPFAVVLAVYFAMRMYALKGFAPISGGAVSHGGHETALNIVYLFSLYLKSMVFPADLTVLHDIPPLATWADGKALVSAIVVVAFASGCLFSARRNPPMFLGFVFFALPLAPALYLPGLVQELRHALADRYLYFSSFGFILVVASLLAWLGLRHRRWLMTGLIAALAVSVAFAVLTVERNAVWKNNHTLWKDALRKAPTSPIANKHYGYALIYRGQIEEGRKHLGIALALDPKIPDAMIDLGIQYSRKGLINKAILEFAATLLFVPDSVEANYNLGLAYQEKGWSKEAKRQYEKVLSIRPDHSDAHVNLGILHAEDGQMNDAIRHFREAIRVKPDDSVARYNLDRALQMK
jgi:tetratricopeptide (TPR) repeat protein